MKFSTKDFLSECNQIRREMRIWSHLLKKSIVENFIFCAVWDQLVLKLTSNSTIIQKEKNWQKSW